ncbi:MAG: hypothetical protein EPO63_00200 [Candidatus Nitrosotenuis sp.]|nr:MAG: hypothetical protein EPO63_00200 [Candidatus Nitrosotenuis sp.]
MHKTVPSALLAIILITSIAVMPSFAEPEHKIGKHLNSKQCRTDDAKKIIQVTQKVLNSVDSGVAGNNWAQDSYIRHIQVWQLSDGSFCAILKYEGHFVTFSGPSPAGTSTVDAGVKGTFDGGYVTTNFTGTLSPTVPTHGSIGSFDYQCDVSGNCPGFVNWIDLYFADTDGFDLTWWGWKYHAGKHGSWVNSIDGNFGDIT